MKLLVVTQVVDKNHPILGFFHGWLCEFAKHFEELHVICLQEGVHTLPDNVYVYSLGKESGENRLKYVYRFYKYFGHIFFSVRVDYVFFHMGAIFNILAAPFFLLRKIQRTSFFWWKAHGRINKFGKLASRLCDTVLTSTASGFPIETPKRRVIGQAIDVDLFNEDDAHQRILNRVIFVGRIMPIKQIEIFLDTVKQLQDLNEVIDVRIIGIAGDRGYKKQLEVKIKTEGIKNVTFVGPLTQSDLVTEYRSAQVFLNTSITNSMDKTVLEAMLCGCVPVTGNFAFGELLSDTPLYSEETVAIAYTTLVQPLLGVNLSDLRTTLATRVKEAHSLDTFSSRVFPD